MTRNRPVADVIDDTTAECQTTRFLNGVPNVGRFCKLNMKNSQVADCLNDRGGAARDPLFYYDADKRI